MAQMKARMNESDGGNGFSKDIIELQNEILKKQKQLERLEAFTDEDVSYTKNNLSALIDKVRTELLDLVPVSEPSDIEARKSVTFEKKMPLSTALFTLLWNTRPQTLPISVLNLKGWAARFVQRLKEGEEVRSNLPTMLIMRSRTDNGEVKGSSGKSRICYSCLHMLAKKGLNVSSPRDSIRFPTKERIDKKMSDTTMFLMDDINFDGASWEELNNFCDGVLIRNKGKYLKEGYIFPYGNILGTTNYDLPYNNDKRYPVIEFTPNDSSVVSKTDCVKNHAKYTYYPAEDRYDFDDAWETLFAYAADDYNKWLEDYATHRAIVSSKCSKQRSRLENLILAFFERDHYGAKDTFRPSAVIYWINENYPREVKRLTTEAVVSALTNLGVQQSNANCNPYSMEFTPPSAKLLKRMFAIECAPVESIYNWLLDNAERQSCDYEQMNKPNEVAVESDATDEVFSDDKHEENIMDDIFNAEVA